MQGLEAAPLVVGASGGLAVDGDEVVPPGPHGGDEGLEAARKQHRIDPVHQVAQPAGARHAVMEIAEAAQEIEMVLAPQDDVVEVVAAGDRGAGHQQQHLLEGVGDTPALAFVVEFGEMLEQDRQSVGGKRHFHRFVHEGLLESEPPTESHPQRQAKTRVNPTAPPCASALFASPVPLRLSKLRMTGQRPPA